MSTHRSVQLKGNIKGLESLTRALKGNKKFVKIGILSGKTSRHGQGSETSSNADIGMKMEFGVMSTQSYTKTRGKKTYDVTVHGIPARSFLRMPLQEKAKEIIKFIAKSKSDNEKKLSEGNITAILKKMGLIGEAIVDKAFTSSGFGKWAPNSPKVIEAKGSSRPLIDTSQLRRSIMSEVEEKK